MIIKPSEITPLTTVKIFELIEEVGIPSGVANLVLGPGETSGAELSSNAHVDLISFTGGIETGKKVMKAASHNVKKDTFELEGKNQNIEIADADCETDVDKGSNTVLFHAGQM